MCDFKPGDEVVCVDDSLQWGVLPCPLIKGKAYTILETPDWPTADGSAAVIVEDRSDAQNGCWRSSRFRKVQRRDLNAWLETADDFEEPKRAPAKEGAA